jgi:hypothetical protein
MTDEVLVHISTPATRQNDNLFRSLANAYTAFQSYQTYRDEPVWNVARPAEPTGLEPNADLTQLRGSATREAADPSILTASKESYGSFPSNLSSEGHLYDWDSALVNNDGSTRPMSRLAKLDRSYLSWRKRTTPRPNFEHGQQGSPIRYSGSEDAETGFIEDSQLAVQALQSQLQDVYSTTSADTSEDDEDHDDNTRILPSARASLEQERPSEIFASSQPSASQEELQDGSAIIGRDSSPLHETTNLSPDAIRPYQNEFDTVDGQVAESRSLDFSMFPTNAFPPAPKISVAHPETLPSQITNHLAVIKANNPYRFRPSIKRRNLDNDERGYWTIDCVRWPQELQHDFWSLLHEHICSGRLGWGTTLHREAESAQMLGRVRLYCWGEVAEHMWLIIWLCSKGRVSGTGLRWIDASGVTILEMR